MLAEPGADPAALRKAVTSPNGTTERAIATFDERGTAGDHRRRAPAPPPTAPPRSPSSSPEPARSDPLSGTGATGYGRWRDPPVGV